MTKADIVEAVYERLREQGSYSKRDAAEIVESVFEKAKIRPADLSAVAVTVGPGLGLCLEVGQG